MPDVLQPVLSITMNNFTHIENQSNIKGKFNPSVLMGAELSRRPTKRIPLLSNVSQEALSALMEKARTATYPNRAMIVAEGDETNSFFIILSGKVQVYSTDDKGKKITLNTQGCGTYFGEIALLTDEPRSVSIICLEKTVCAIISKRDFIHWLIKYPDAMFTLLGELSNKIKDLTDKVKLMALSNVYERTIKVLKEMAVVQGQVSVIHNRPSQQDLAYMVGASREMINKIFHDLTKGGYILNQDNALILNKNLPSSW